MGTVIWPREGAGAARPGRTGRFARRTATSRERKVALPRLSFGPRDRQNARVQGELDLYRRCHRELSAAAARLDAADRASLATRSGAADARDRLAALSGKLLVHLQMEDRSLYPYLLRSESADVRATAARFQLDVGSLRGAADAFSGRWLRPAAIEQAPEAFLADLRRFLHALSVRIAAEDAELFPLAERSR